MVCLGEHTCHNIKYKIDDVLHNQLCVKQIDINHDEYCWLVVVSVTFKNQQPLQNLPHQIFSFREKTALNIALIHIGDIGDFGDKPLTNSSQIILGSFDTIFIIP